MSPWVLEENLETLPEEPGPEAGVLKALVADVQTVLGTDVTTTEALRLLSGRHILMCARSKCFRKRLEIGPTVANQQGYPVPAEVVEIRELQVNGVPYGQGRHTDLREGELGYLALGGLYLWLGGGIGVHDYGAGGNELLALFPTPTEAGLSVRVFAVCRPPALEDVEEDGNLKIPVEFREALVSGALATGIARIADRQDMAVPYEQQFAQACSELAQQVDRRYRGSGPSQIRIAGVNG